MHVLHDCKTCIGDEQGLSLETCMQLLTSCVVALIRDLLAKQAARNNADCVLRHISCTVMREVDFCALCNTPVSHMEKALA